MGISTTEGGGPADPRSLEQLEPFDDGFAPSTCEGEPARLLRQPPLSLMPPHLLVLRDAIGENIVVIARRKAILADLLKLLAETDPSQPAAAAATAAPPLTADGSTADAGVYL